MNKLFVVSGERKTKMPSELVKNVKWNFQLIGELVMKWKLELVKVKF